MITVELHVFSGRPNPTWTLTAQEESELLARATAEPTLTQPPSKVGDLGYRGFSIAAEGESAPKWQAAKLPTRFHITAHEVVERQLLNATNAGQTATDKVRQFAKDSIDAANQAWRQRWLQAERAVKGPPQTPPGRNEKLLNAPTPVPSPNSKRAHPEKAAPPSPLLRISLRERFLQPAGCGSYDLTSDTDFSFWNSDPYVQEHNNCYNFAADWQSDTFAQPGRKSNTPFATTSCADVAYSAAYDGFTNDCWVGGEYYTALVIWPGQDFHWYRLCANGHWCHKPGSTPARNYDNSGYWITDPATCDRGPYTDFCGYKYFPDTYTVQ
jgi:hypothetical protein